jgi:hypothetical protein
MEAVILRKTTSLAHAGHLPLKGKAKDDVERWRDIPGFGGKYQASTEGRVRRTYQKAPPKILVPWHHHARKSPVVKLTYPEGRTVVRTVLWVMGQTWYDLPEGAIAVHANGLHTDNHMRNIVVYNRKGLGKQFGRLSSSRPVAKVDADGHVVDFYPSARAAGRANHMSYQTVLDRCNGKVKKPFALDGFNYRWDEGEYTDGADDDHPGRAGGAKHHPAAKAKQ